MESLSLIAALNAGRWSLGSIAGARAAKVEGSGVGGRRLGYPTVRTGSLRARCLAEGGCGECNAIERCSN